MTIDYGSDYELHRYIPPHALTMALYSLARLQRAKKNLDFSISSISASLLLSHSQPLESHRKATWSFLHRAGYHYDMNKFSNQTSHESLVIGHYS